MRRRVGPAEALLALVTALCLAAIGLAPTSLPSAQSAQLSTPTPISGAGPLLNRLLLPILVQARLPATCRLDWRLPSSPSPGLVENSLEAVAIARGPTGPHVWAVGWYTDPTGRYYNLALREQAGQWRQVLTPNIGSRYNYLSGVAAIAPDNIWAVGSYANDGGPSQTLILHWDGEAWQHIPSPSVGTRYNSLSAVTALSATDIWAVGAFANDASAFQTLILHFDGVRWHHVRSLNVSARYNNLAGVAAYSPTDVWAVGAYDNGPLMLHWDGRDWSFSNPGSTPRNAELNAVAVTGPNSVWAIGREAAGFETVADTTLILHWDGRQWSRIPSPTVGRGLHTLKSISAVAPDNIWAVGGFIPADSLANRGLVLHYNGSAWTTVPRPALPPHLVQRHGVAASPTGGVWIVGARQTDPASRTLIERATPLCP